MLMSRMMIFQTLLLTAGIIGLIDALPVRSRDSVGLYGGDVDDDDDSRPEAKSADYVRSRLSSDYNDEFDNQDGYGNFDNEAYELSSGVRQKGVGDEEGVDYNEQGYAPDDQQDFEPVLRRGGQTRSAARGGHSDEESESSDSDDHHHEGYKPKKKIKPKVIIVKKLIPLSTTTSNATAG